MKMNAQEIFDTVATHLFTQGQQSRDACFGKCAYRTKTGLTCAGGCLIQDYYVSDMDLLDFSGIETVYRKFRKILPEWIEGNMELLEFLQAVHDNTTNWATVDFMKESLTEVALKRNLDYSVLNKFERFGS